jgi:hypothetical protein
MLGGEWPKPFNDKHRRNAAISWDLQPINFLTRPLLIKKAAQIRHYSVVVFGKGNDHCLRLSLEYLGNSEVRKLRDYGLEENMT